MFTIGAAVAHFFHFVQINRNWIEASCLEKFRTVRAAFALSTCQLFPWQWCQAVWKQSEIGIKSVLNANTSFLCTLLSFKHPLLSKGIVLLPPPPPFHSGLFWTRKKGAVLSWMESWAPPQHCHNTQLPQPPQGQRFESITGIIK